MKSTPGTFENEAGTRCLEVRAGEGLAGGRSAVASGPTVSTSLFALETLSRSAQSAWGCAVLSGE